MGLFGGPAKLNLSEYQDISSLSSEKQFTLKVYAMRAVGANPVGPNNQFLSEYEIDQILRKRAVDPNDFAYLINLLLDRRMMRAFS